MYTWGYLKSSILAKLDLEEAEVDETNSFVSSILSRIVYFANEAITQISSSIKPREDFVEILVTEDDIKNGYVIKDVRDYLHGEFISFGDDENTIAYNIVNIPVCRACCNDDFKHRGQFKLMFFKSGVYSISCNLRWYTFKVSDDNDVVLDVPNDILDSIPSYVASQCYKIDDEYKAQVYRNEYEIFLARIDDTSYRTSTDITIGGDW